MSIRTPVRKYLSLTGLVTCGANDRKLSGGAVYLPTRLTIMQVPQVRTYTELSTDNAGQMSDLMKAVNSIPAYVDKCSHFFTICPPVRPSSKGASVFKSP